MDCLWQLLHQFPKAFEYTEQVLVLTLMHLYSCRFGTFLMNADKERHDAQVDQLTSSYWIYLEKEVSQNSSVFINLDITHGLLVSLSFVI